MQWKGPESGVGVNLGDILEALNFANNIYESLSIMNIVV